MKKDDLVKMYKTKSKVEIIEMLIKCNSIIENLTNKCNLYTQINNSLKEKYE